VTIVLDIWRQRGLAESGGFVRYDVPDVDPNMSLLEALDVLNQRLVVRGEDPVFFDSDCREGICGTCGFLIDGEPHGPVHPGTVCQLYLRSFRTGQRLRLEPWRAAAFPVLRDLSVDRCALDRIIEAGGYVSTRTGSAPEANAILVPKDAAERAMDAAACIGCGACVAVCPNASAALFTGAKITHLASLPQGSPERERRASGMVAQAKREGFGHCTTIGECEAVCPAGIRLEVIARMNKEFLRTTLRGDRLPATAALPPREATPGR
jgi:succinate dehydrogenase iron-sulfur subunit